MHHQSSLLCVSGRAFLLCSVPCEFLKMLISCRHSCLRPSVGSMVSLSRNLYLYIKRKEETAKCKCLMSPEIHSKGNEAETGWMLSTDNETSSLMSLFPSSSSFLLFSCILLMLISFFSSPVLSCC